MSKRLRNERTQSMHDSLLNFVLETGPDGNCKNETTDPPLANSIEERSMVVLCALCLATTERDNRFRREQAQSMPRSRSSKCAPSRHTDALISFCRIVSRPVKVSESDSVRAPNVDVFGLEPTARQQLTTVVRIE